MLENPPPRLVEFVAVLESRRTVARIAAVGFLVLGALVTLLAPSVLPRHPVVGAAVGLGAVLVGVAAVLATDANDLIIRGPQHVRAAGARRSITVADTPTPATVARLADLVAERVTAGARVVAIVPASKSVRDVPRWSDLVAIDLSERGQHVVVVDLTGTWGEIDELGVVDVARGRCKLSEAVTFDPDVTVARLGTGADPQAARESLVGFLARVPADVNLVLLAMPSLTMAGALTAVGAADGGLVLAEVDVTHRLALIGTLDAIDDVGVEPDVVLLDRAGSARIVAPEPEPSPTGDIQDEPADDGLVPIGVAARPTESLPDRRAVDALPPTQPIPAMELVDVTGRDAVRTAAALGTFAEEVWRRGDAE